MTDLFFGLGGFTIKSTVDLTATKEAWNSWKVTFTKWIAQVTDNYNWDKGKSVYVPGWGAIQDIDALRVERAGKSKSFLIQSQPWQVIDPSIVGVARVTA